jgi:hypothetical protein
MLHPHLILVLMILPPGTHGMADMLHGMQVCTLCGSGLVVDEGVRVEEK